jgi:1,2-dihydroxy-3-keto-5-methylthiopentene dioxygenase
VFYMSVESPRHTIPQGRLDSLPDWGDRWGWPLSSGQLAQLDSVVAPLKAEWGYGAHDVVALTSETPNLAGILAAFRQEHHHTDDEVRLIVAGEGIFGIIPSDETPPYTLHLRRGDWIIIPANTRHWFDLTAMQQVIAVRLFKDNPAWTAIY